MAAPPHAEGTAGTRVCNFTVVQRRARPAASPPCLRGSKGMNKILINVMQQFPTGCSRSCCMQTLLRSHLSPRKAGAPFFSGGCCINLHSEWGSLWQELLDVLDPTGSARPSCSWVSARFFLRALGASSKRERRKWRDAVPLCSVCPFLTRLECYRG